MTEKITDVLDYFDDECTCPINFVQQTDDGFEAIATHISSSLDGPHDEGRERLIGVFKDRKAAIKALREYLRRVELADPMPSFGFDFDALPPLTIH